MNEETEIRKLPSLEGAAPEEIAHAIFDVLDAKKAEDIKVLHVHDHTVITDYFIICSGRSSTQVKSLGGEVEFKLGLRHAAPAHYEGRDNGNWVVLDYGSVIVHIFSRDSRDFYKLEKLYGDAEEIHFIGIDEKWEAEQQ
jgi:ribosome-associated protein